MACGVVEFFNLSLRRLGTASLSTTSVMTASSSPFPSTEGVALDTVSPEYEYYFRIQDRAKSREKEESEENEESEEKRQKGNGG